MYIKNYIAIIVLCMYQFEMPAMEGTSTETNAPRTVTLRFIPQKESSKKENKHNQQDFVIDRDIANLFPAIQGAIQSAQSNNENIVIPLSLLELIHNPVNAVKTLEIIGKKIISFAEDSDTPYTFEEELEKQTPEQLEDLIALTHYLGSDSILNQFIATAIKKSISYPNILLDMKENTQVTDAMRQTKFYCSYLQTLWIAESKKITPMHILSQSVIFSPSWSPDNTRIAFGSKNATLTVWNIKNPKNSLSLKGHLLTPVIVRWNHDGTQIASVGGKLENKNDRDTIRIWNSTTGKQLFTLNHASGINSIAWHPQENILASGGNDGFLHIWNTKTGDLEEKFQTSRKNAITSIAWNPNGQYIAVGNYEDSDIDIWDIEQKKLTQRLSSNRGTITTISWSPDGKYIACSNQNSSQNRTLTIWDSTTAKILYTLHNYVSSNNHVASLAWSSNLGWSSNSKFLAFAQYNGIGIWDSQCNKLIRTLKKNQYSLINDNHYGNIGWIPNTTILTALFDHEELLAWHLENHQLENECESLKSLEQIAPIITYYQYWINDKILEWKKHTELLKYAHTLPDSIKTLLHIPTTWDDWWQGIKSFWKKRSTTTKAALITGATAGTIAATTAGHYLIKHYQKYKKGH